jgi:hypothetical protein
MSVAIARQIAKKSFDTILFPPIVGQYEPRETLVAWWCSVKRSVRVRCHSQDIHEGGATAGCRVAGADRPTFASAWTG